MAKPPDTLVEIPPPETTGTGPGWLAIGVVSLSMLAGVAVFVGATEPRLPAFEWGRGEGPTSVNLDSMVALDDGFAVLSGMTVEGVLLWWSDGGVWDSTSLDGAPRQLAALGEGLLAYDADEGLTMVGDESDRFIPGHGIVFPEDIRARQSSGRPSVVPAGDGYLAMSLVGNVWWTDDGATFEAVISDPVWGPGTERPFDSDCSPPSRISPDVPPIAAASSSMIALVSSNPDEPFGLWPVCEPVPWSSTDGIVWSETRASFGEGAYVYDIAGRNGLLVAVGGRGFGDPHVWASEDGGTWHDVASFSELDGVDLYTVEAGAAGWVILAKQSDGPGTVGWTSIDGACWSTLPAQVTGLDVAVSDEQILVIDRTTYPEVWLGTATGSGSC